MLQPHNAAVFYWPGATWPCTHRLRKTRVGRRKNIQWLLLTISPSEADNRQPHHGEARAPFRLPHRQGRAPPRTSPPSPVEHLRNEYFSSGGVDLTQRWWRRGKVILQSASPKFIQRNLKFYGLSCFLTKKFPWNEALIASVGRKRNSQLLNNVIKKSFLVASFCSKRTLSYQFFSNFYNSTVSLFSIELFIWLFLMTSGTLDFGFFVEVACSQLQ